MVFQSYALYPHLTVYDNLAFGLRRMAAKPGDDEAFRWGESDQARPCRQTGCSRH
jgi:multiple sugar transport system ATP-binding protein